jgi:hypothetical protein
MPPFLEILRLMYPSPGNLKLMHLSPGNSKVNAPPPLEIQRLMHPLPWKFQGSSTGGVQIIIGIAHYIFAIKLADYDQVILNKL